MDEEEQRSILLEAVFDHYDITWPNGAGNRKVLCPVHDDRNASASVNTSTGLWTCFTCGAGGDAYSLIEIKEGVSFHDATRIAQEILDRNGSGVCLSPAGQPSGRVSRGKRDRSPGRKYRPSWMDR